MRAPIDVLVDSAVNAVANAGVPESIARMAVVETVNTNGTINVTVDDGTVPGVRLLSGYYAPRVGDIVEVMRTVGGWVCLGALRTVSSPVMQVGTATTPAPGANGGWTQTNITFPVPFSATPVVVATVRYSGTTAGIRVTPSVINESPTGFTLRVDRSTNSTTSCSWIAIAP